MQPHHYNNIGYGLHKFTSEELQPIWDEINTLDHNLETPTGLVNHKCSLKLSMAHVEQLVGQQIAEFNWANNWPNRMKILKEPTPLKLSELWVNWMSRHEFSSIHKHDGVMSFVIWLTVPYTLESELAARPHVPDYINFGGQFALHYTDSLGQISTKFLPVYNDWESTLCLFPAGTSHSVFPYYSSNQLRVSVAGNFTFDTD
jgi:hypothetical protein